MKKLEIILSILFISIFFACEKTVINNYNNPYNQSQPEIKGQLSVDSSILNLGGAINSIDSFVVSANKNFIINSQSSWLVARLKNTNGVQEVVVSTNSSNNTDSIRKGSLTIYLLNDTIKPLTVSVTQSPYLISNPNGQNCNANPYRIGTSLIFSITGGGTSTENFTKDTIINNTTYFGTKILSGRKLIYVYYGVDSLGNTRQIIPAIGDYPASNMIYCKTNQPIGTYWNDTFPSNSLPTVISYVYTHKILQTGNSFTIGGITYSNCTQIQETLTTLSSGIPTNSQSSITTFACGIGVIETEENGKIYSTLAAYNY